MSARALSHLTIAGFILLGVVCLGTRYRVRQAEQTARENSLWRLSYDIRFETAPGDATVRIALPTTTPHAEIVRQELIHPGRDDKVEQSRATGNRDLVITTQHADSYRVTAEFDILLKPEETWRSQRIPQGLSQAARSRYLRREDNLPDPRSSPALQRALQRAPGGDITSDQFLQWAFDYCSSELRPADPDDSAANDVQIALEGRKATPLGRARSMVALCRAARLPARLVTGIELRQVETPQPHVWVEVFRGHEWVPFDPEYGYARRMPINFIPLRRGGEDVVRTQGLKTAKDDQGTKRIVKPVERFSVIRLGPENAILDAERRHLFQILDLTRLPMQMYTVMSLILLLPLAALITAVMRTMVGIRTFGTFAPALLAMSFIYAAWGTGVVILVVVLAAGLTGRSLLERLHLLMVPRLSVILTAVILCVVFCVSVLDFSGLTPSAQAVLLPLVILTIMIERFFVTSEEDGVMFSVELALGTIFVAVLCWLLLRWDDVGRYILIYPETHFFTIAALIFVGRYAGYRLTELWRFRDLFESSERP